MRTTLACISVALCSLFAIPLSIQAEAVSPAVDPPSLHLEASRDEIPDWLARWELARVLSYINRHAESIEEYVKLLKEKPNLWKARAEMATILYWSGEHEASLKELSGIPPQELPEQGQILMAELYVARENYDGADRIYRNYLEKNPQDLTIRLRRAEVLSWAKRYDDSLLEYEKILAQRPSDIQARRKYAFVLIWADRHQEAARELRKTLP